MTHYCVISHTHWDREWYLSQEVFRLRLADLIDHLLEILAREPEYIFHLDAQTVVLEDYFDIRPEQEALCRKYIREGRLLVGPWYVQNDFLLTSGEATVRNLLLGIRQAEDYGRCMQIGYAPDQFGLISQLPQILRQFGFDCCIFGRGYHGCYIDENGQRQEHMLPSEFRWRGPDGSEVLGICMSFWYNNAQRFSADIDRAVALARLQKERFSGIAQTPYLLCMNGCDHLEPQDDLLPVLRAVQARLDPDEKIYQTTLEHYAACVKEALRDVPLTEQTGELLSGLDVHILKDTASSRIYLKTENAALQNRLERRLEPLYTMLETAGMTGSYPKSTLDYLWKMLIRNHAHDSICGCSKDAVHRHMEDRFAAIEESAQELERRGLALLNAHISRDGLSAQDYLITVVNTLPRPRTSCVDVRLDVLASDKPKGVSVYGPDGACVPYVLLGRKRVNRRVTSPVNLPGFLETEQFDLRLLAEDVPACGSRSYRVRVDTPSQGQTRPERCGEAVLENQFLRVEITPAGKIDLLHKESGRWYRDVLTLEDSADAGHSYISVPLDGDIPYGLHDGGPVSVECFRDAVRQEARLRFVMRIPEGLSENHRARSPRLVDCPVALTLQLDSRAPMVRVDWEIENHARDHRLRMLVNTGLDRDVTTALSPFDLVEHRRSDIDVRLCNETRHNSGLVDISDGDIGLSILNCGVYSYENLQQRPGTLALTLLRATGRIWPEETSGAPEDEAWLAEENQCLRTIRIQTALYPHRGGSCQADAAHWCDCLQTPMLAAAAAVDTRKFLGGRPALQEAAIAEFFYQPDPYPQVRLPRENSVLSLPEGAEMTTLKKSEDGSAYVLRFFRTGKDPRAITPVIDPSRFAEIVKSDLREQPGTPLPLEEGRCTLTAGPGEIVTLRLLPGKKTAVDICEKQRALFQNTYASLRGRIHPNGYAPTSVTGAYEGMFSRDSSIQIMAHVACRDYEAARMLLSYIFSYHRQYGYDFALHMMLEDRPPYSDMVQADATFFLLHAWYLYAVHAPQSEEKERLLAQTEEQAVGFANYFLTPEFYRQDWNLLRNQNLEGPRQHSYFNCYDLLTNVYASQALHEFALYFARKRPSQAAHWEQTAQALRRGIHENLTAVVDGKPIYMEMHALTRNDGRKYHNIPHRKSYVGFSWVNLSVLGVKWFGADPALLENTYAAYRKYAFVPYDGGCLLPEHSSEYQSTGTCVLEKHHVLGKALAWELIYCHDTGRIQRVGEILDFVARCSDELYRESWNYAGGGRDAANQEHASWMVCAVRYALRKNAEIAEQTANEG